MSNSRSIHGNLRSAKHRSNIKCIIHCNYNVEDMKILHVITSLEIGGAEHLLVDILPRFRDKGNTVELCVLYGVRTHFYDELEQSGIKIHSLGMGANVYNPFLIPKLYRLMKGYDIVHTHNYAPQLFAALSKFGKVRIITTEHSTSTRRRNKKILNYLDKWMYQRYNKIICISKPSEDSLVGYLSGLGLRKMDNILTINNGVNVSRFVNADTIDLGLGDCKKITMVAGFRYEKDQPTLIKALRYLPEDYHVILVGDGAERSNLETLIADEGLQDRVHLLGLRNDVPNILKSSDVIVMSSHREGLSLSNVEGMSTGHPFVASDVEGLREVTNGYGLLFPHGDSKALAEIIQKLCSDKRYADEVAARCKERAMQYDIQKMVDEYQQVYDEIMAK